jgi:ParB-like chromosome segregation protein Spo0J
MKIECTPVRELRPHVNNARTHSKKQIRQIARSIEKFGFCNPVLVDDAKLIIAGHGRVEAAKLLGMDEVPTCQLSHLSEADKRTYILADNKLGELAGWDRELLAIELQGLIELDVDIELTGFETVEIDLILKDAREANGDASEPEEIVPSPGPTVTETGDLWLLGSHRLLCADARDQGSYDRLLEGARAEFVFTDPPNNFASNCNVSGKMSEAESIAFLQTVFSRLAENTVNGSIYRMCTGWRSMSQMLAASGGYELTGMDAFYRSKHELVLVWKFGTATHTGNFERGPNLKHRNNVSGHAGPMGNKPASLIADTIKRHCRRGGLVLDPFCGSGTILIAAERAGRKMRALEIDPKLVDVAVRRWQAHAGKSAVLSGSGETFEAVEDRRLAKPTAA